MSRRRRLVEKYYLFLKDFFYDLFEDKVGYYASALSWSTLFSIIPLLVLLLFIFTHLPVFHEVYGNVKSLIFANLMPTQSELILAKIDEFIENSSRLGWIGFAYVLFAVGMFLKNYDYIVNDIFEMPPRSFMQSVRTYGFLLLLLPTMLAASFYLSETLHRLVGEERLEKAFHLYTLLPFLISWGIFYIAYQFSANRPIRRRAALASSFIASLVWYLSKNAFVFYVMHNRTYTSIYGSIGALLFFFLWIYISWAIFLHGLRFCYLLEKEEEEEEKTVQKR